MKKRLTIVLAGVLVLALAVTVLAASGSIKQQAAWRKIKDTPLGRLIMGQVGRSLILKSEFKLTNEQQAVIRAIINAHRGEIADVARQIIACRRNLANQVRAENTDEQAIRAAADELGKAIGNAAVLAAKVAQEIRPILTAQQQKSLENFRINSETAVDQWLEEFAAGR